MSGSSAPAPPPSLGFSVAIVGHRSERIVDPQGVRARIDEVLATIQATLDDLTEGPLFEAGRHKLRLVSALADGADRIAAQAALDLGEALEVVLPFAPAEYERDFENQAQIDEFRALLARASSVVVLDGHLSGRPLAYEAAGFTLLDNCDLLIAVWDGEAGRGRGGTREVIGEAARRAMPVVLIPPDGSRAAIHGSLRMESRRFEDLPENPISMLPELVAAEVGIYGDQDEEAEWRTLATMPPDPVIHEAYPLLLKLAGVRPWFRRKSKPAPAPAPGEAPPPPGALDLAFQWWDTAATRAAQAFRSAVLVNFSLAALAVVLSASSVLAGEAKPAFVLAEIVTILLLLVNAMHAAKMGWQERWLESRQVAELLRVCGMLRQVGIGREIADPGVGGSNAWYAGAIGRSMAMLSVDLSEPEVAAAPLLEEIRGQAGWNEATAHRMHLAAHRIERFGEVLFAIVLAAAIGWLVLYMVDYEAAEHLKHPLISITAGLPAVATASYGVRIILDFEGTAGRAKQIAIGLNNLLARWEAGPKTSVALQGFARRAAEIMLGDVAAWRLLAEGRRLTIPG